MKKCGKLVQNRSGIREYNSGVTEHGQVSSVQRKRLSMGAGNTLALILPAMRPVYGEGQDSSPQEHRLAEL